MFIPSWQLVPPRWEASRTERVGLCNHSLPAKYPLTREGETALMRVSVFCHSSQPAEQWDSERAGPTYRNVGTETQSERGRKRWYFPTGD